MLYAQPFADEFALNDGAGKRRPAPVNQGRDCGAVRWNAAMATPLRIQGRMDAVPDGANRGGMRLKSRRMCLLFVQCVRSEGGRTT